LKRHRYKPYTVAKCVYTKNRTFRQTIFCWTELASGVLASVIALFLSVSHGTCDVELCKLLVFVVSMVLSAL
jgi:hypothetical protein